VVTADSADPLVPLLNTFGVFAVGFSMRPLAGLLPGSVAEASVRHPELFPWSVAVLALFGLVVYARRPETAHRPPG